MDNVNRIISFILGLIVVVVFIAIVTGRFKLGTNTKKVAKVSPTVTVKVTPTPTRKVVVTYNNQPTATNKTYGGYNSTTQSNQATQGTQGTQGSAQGSKTPSTNANQYNSNSYQNNTPAQIANNNLSTIPNTGAPTLLIPAALSMLAGGTFLKKLGKRK